MKTTSNIKLVKFIEIPMNETLTVSQTKTEKERSVKKSHPTAPF